MDKIIVYFELLKYITDCIFWLFGFYSFVFLIYSKILKKRFMNKRFKMLLNSTEGDFYDRLYNN